MVEIGPPPREEIARRVERFQASLADLQVDGALLAQKVDVYYFSGTDQDAHLWIPTSGVPVLLVRKSLERARRDARLDRVEPLGSLRELPELLEGASAGKLSRLALELDVIPASSFLQYRRLLPGAEILDASPVVRTLRMIKSPYEMACMREAARIADRLFERIPDLIRDSKNETELAVRAEGFYRRHGHPGVSRTRAFNIEPIYGHIMAGPGGAEPSGTVGPTGGAGLGPWFSQGAGWTPIRPGQPIMVDYTAFAGGYLADQARVFSVGALPDKMRRAFAVMVEVQNALADAGRPGVSARELYDRALSLVDRAGLREGFMGFPHPVPFVGHGLGLELDEWPVITDRADFVLEEGMTMALEPKIVYPGEGVIGVENTFVVGADRLEALNAFPDELVVL